ncbi:M81 family metallopeptidase [Kutzneria albida]|uniref:Microcystin LR degradation protein MlrC n=1 Tax=Kutzneria albida DSM 43870 TaxID=1449976 RepID=W5WMQ5_9PSEU|nr:M81 family metallopeptidase [Kutzneria albida]AHI01822.1 hypothetical protein KALB_8465 [Kutzneria albida DSM 43870]
MLRIGIGGIHIESSTFSPHRAELADFTVTRGQDLLDRYGFTGEDWGVEWVPLVHAVALPGGAVTRAAYQELKDELVNRVAQAGPLDGLLYDIHGAMSVVGLVDAELDLTYAVRGALGPKPLISAAMDLHGNVSRRFAELLDLITAHRLAPHEDAWLTRERAARNLVDRLRSGGRPHRAWVQVPVLLPGEKTSTRLEPARSLYGSLAEVADQPGIVDAAIWVGYAWADEPRCQAAVVVTGDDEDLVLREAGDLAQRYWEARADFVFVGPTGSADECIARAVQEGVRPFVLSDSGDNPTAGGAGDLPFMLGRLLANEELASAAVTAVHASITDPTAVARCFAAGMGSTVRLSVGGKVDAGHGGPLEITGAVTGLQPGDPVGGDVAAVTTGGVTVILTSRRKPYHRLADFTAIGIDPHDQDLLVVKIGYLEPELHELAKGWLLALTPGGVDQDLGRLGHHRVTRPLYPFDEFEGPDLTPRLL